MTPVQLWKISLVVLPLALAGCAGMGQEIAEDRQDVRRSLEQRASYYEKHEYFGLPAQERDWNSTDWSLWMDTHGGGR